MYGKSCVQVCTQLPKLPVEPCSKREGAEIWYAICVYIKMSRMVGIFFSCCITRHLYCIPPDVVLLCDYMAGTDGVVVGDLVYCKDQCCKEVRQTPAECEEDSLNEVDGSGNLEEVLEIVSYNFPSTPQYLTNCRVIA